MLEAADYVIRATTPAIFDDLLLNSDQGSNLVHRVTEGGSKVTFLGNLDVDCLLLLRLISIGKKLLQRVP